MSGMMLSGPSPEELQIVGVVVLTVAVPMMDNLVCRQRTAQYNGHNQSMFSDRGPLTCHRWIVPELFGRTGLSGQVDVVVSYDPAAFVGMVKNLLSTGPTPVRPLILTEQTSDNARRFPTNVAAMPAGYLNNRQPVSIGRLDQLDCAVVNSVKDRELFSTVNAHPTIFDTASIKRPLTDSKSNRIGCSDPDFEADRTDNVYDPTISGAFSARGPVDGRMRRQGLVVGAGRLYHKERIPCAA